MSETYRDILEVTPTDGRGGFVSANDPDFNEGRYATVYGDSFIVLDISDDSLYMVGKDGSYNRELGKVKLVSTNFNPAGVFYWAEEEVLLICERSSDEKVYAYSVPEFLEGRAARREELEFDLTGVNDDPRGVVVIGDNAYVLDDSDDHVYFYNADREYSASDSFDLTGVNNAPLSLGVVGSGDDTRLLVLEDTEVFIYEPDGTGAVVNPNLNSANQNGIWIAGEGNDTVWVGDSTDHAIYEYDEDIAFRAAGTIRLNTDKRMASAIMSTENGTAAIIAADSLGQPRAIPLRANIPFPIECLEWRSTGNTFSGSPDFYALFGPEDGRSDQRV